MCITGHCKEHGFLGLHGYACESAVVDFASAIKISESLSEVGVLVEPMTMPEKGISVAYSIQNARMNWEPRKALVLGAGSIGMSATALLRLMGLEVQVIATKSEESIKARLVDKIGAKYSSAKSVSLKNFENQYDLVIEATGNASLAFGAHKFASLNGIVCYFGVYPRVDLIEDIGNVFTNLVMGNKVFVGSLSANKTHFLRAARDLYEIKKRWPSFLDSVITRSSMPDNFREAYAPMEDDGIKAIIDFKSNHNANFVTRI